jgi:hypothetical protein
MHTSCVGATLVQIPIIINPTHQKKIMHKKQTSHKEITIDVEHLPTKC